MSRGWLERLANPGPIGRFGLSVHVVDPVLQATDLGLDLVAAGVLKEPLEHVLRVEHTQINP